MNQRVLCFLSFVLACGVAVSSLAADAPGRENRGQTVRHQPSDRGKQMQALHQSLRAAEPAGVVRRPLMVTLSSAEKALAEPQAEGRYRVGVSKNVGVNLDPALKTVPFGVRELRADRGVLWSGVVRSPGASAIRLYFSPFDLPEGAELYVYGPERQAFGPYTGRGPVDDGEVWTNTVWGEEARLQLRLPTGVTGARLILAAVGYMGKSFPRALADLATFCPNNENCVVNAACANIPNPIQLAKDAVADMLFASGGYYYLCTGGLVADSDPTSTVPYFLTANHCISKRGEASSLETYFDYETTCNSPDCTAPFDQSPRDYDTLGAVIKSTNRTGDYTLLQLSSLPDTSDGVEHYLGWNSTAVANTDGAHLYRISHPGGSPQAYSEHLVDVAKPTCSSWPRGNWIYSRDVIGATEGGSSGSPVLNANGEIVGQLSGACGFNVNDPCDSANNATVDGAFANYFDQVAPFLAGGGAQCKPSGDTCSMNSECCSNSCKGKPGAKICK
jgi:V8-like Glu-specific endopeptidase